MSREQPPESGLSRWATPCGAPSIEDATIRVHLLRARIVVLLLIAPERVFVAMQLIDDAYLA